MNDTRDEEIEKLKQEIKEMKDKDAEREESRKYSGDDVKKLMTAFGLAILGNFICGALCYMVSAILLGNMKKKNTGTYILMVACIIISIYTFVYYLLLNK